MTHDLSLLSGLPGEELILKGLADLAEGRHTIETCLVRIAVNRLSRLGISLPDGISTENAELELYALLAPMGNNAHSTYNSMIRQLISFEQSLDHRITRAA
jgi:hypothetical protein